MKQLLTALLLTAVALFFIGCSDSAPSAANDMEDDEPPPQEEEEPTTLDFSSIAGEWAGQLRVQPPYGNCYFDVEMSIDSTDVVVDEYVGHIDIWYCGASELDPPYCGNHWYALDVTEEPVYVLRDSIDFGTCPRGRALLKPNEALDSLHVTLDASIEGQEADAIGYVMPNGD